MLEGLEAVELKLSEVLEDNESFRIDSEYFKKEYLEIYKILKNNYIKRLYTLGDIKGGKRLPLGENFCNCQEGVYYIRAEDIRNGFIDYANSPKISLELHKKLIKYQTKNDDVLLTIVGNSIGDIGIVKFNLDKCNLTENAAKILNLKEIKSDYLFIFLLSKYGQIQIKKEKVGTAQPKLALERIRRFIIPILSQTFQQQIENIVKSAYEKLKLSKELYKEAEDILLKELDLKDFKPSKKNISIKSFKESFLKSGRLDSEYYQPKYEQIESKIKSYKGGWDFVGNILNLKDKNFHPKKDEFYKYIELSNIGNTGEITGYTYNRGKELPTRARRLVKKDDVIISSIEGSLEKVALVTEKFDNSLCSTGFYVVNSDFLNSATILVLFKNKVFQQILKQNCSGTILTGINKDDFLNIVIPKIDNTIQTQIEEKIRESFKLKKESKELLELAKRAVEVAIESGEDEAMGVLKI